ncbi:MAG: GGDEF domain-containing protein [Armatimonadetes bacterium]|nr:GGDEF domain-containing protein [Armatimonadota bacterium]
MRVIIWDEDKAHAAALAEGLRDRDLECLTVSDDAACLLALRTGDYFDALVYCCNGRSSETFDRLNRLRRAGHALRVILLLPPGSPEPGDDLSRLAGGGHLYRSDDFSHLSELASLLQRLGGGAPPRERRRRRDAAPQQRQSTEPPPRDTVLADPVTGLYSSSVLLPTVREFYDKAQRYHTPLSLAIIDLDHFGQINSIFGHLIGDEVLGKVAALMRSCFRSADLLFRHGGEEFAVLMPHSEARDSLVACDRFLTQLRTSPVTTAVGPLRVTASVGVAALTNGNFLRPEELIAAADSALCMAKAAGRDRVVLADGASRPPEAMTAAA